MLLYDSIGPNPRVVRMFMAERGVEIPKTTIDLRGGENRRPPYLAKNPAGQLPCLELDDGTVLAEITAICEYLDEIAPGPSLIGNTPRERAETRMWVRRIDLNIIEPMTNGFRFSQGLKLFQNRIRCIPAAADDLKLTAQEKLAWLDGLIQGREFICGSRLTLADMMLFCFLDFAAQVGQPLNPALQAVTALYGRMKARPSAAA
ncbi:glutathione S-transferase family protein [Paracraurococcus lichenis]|uniref:Glutathione S-transferase family protein n=1 Tax=Paracraurococcus lichenis TaxID=3064888 RepID=A0ABT9DTP3_9PROT|nr:glutathione S-transferase family protein [Paracraurococcus sp. LOR1-02]MDO9707276.1 glutathione S-transferase family protein [Paracraurococcus sp. LOR1-02]